MTIKDVLKLSPKIRCRTLENKLIANSSKSIFELKISLTVTGNYEYLITL